VYLFAVLQLDVSSLLAAQFAYVLVLVENVHILLAPVALLSLDLAVAELALAAPLFDHGVST